jgi:hypothetical protein
MRNNCLLRTLVLPLLVLLLVIVCHGVASACPSCKDSLAYSDANHQTLVRGYFWSILFMMSMPFLILSGLGTYMYMLVRRGPAGQGQAITARGPAALTLGEGSPR